MKENIVKDKSFAFALRVLRLFQSDTIHQKEYEFINPEVVELCKRLTRITHQS